MVKLPNVGMLKIFVLCNILTVFLMEGTEYIYKPDHDINSSTSRINDDPSVVSSLFWEGNISDKLSINRSQKAMEVPLCY